MGIEVLPQVATFISIVIAVVEVVLLLVIGLWYMERRNPTNTPARQKEIQENIHIGYVLFFIVIAIFLLMKAIGPLFRLLFSS